MGDNELKSKKMSSLTLNAIKIVPLLVYLHYMSSHAQKHANSISIFEVLDVPMAMDQSEPNYGMGKG